MIIEREMPKETRMKGNEMGRFSLSLKSLQLQLQTLLEDAGGEKVVELLDALCELNAAEQRLVLDIFGRLTARVANGDLRVTDQSGEEHRQIEEAIFKDIVSAMSAAPKSEVVRKYRFEVVDGGRAQSRVSGKAGVVHINELRKARRSGSKPLH